MNYIELIKQAAIPAEFLPMVTEITDADYPVPGGKELYFDKQDGFYEAPVELDGRQYMVTGHTSNDDMHPLYCAGEDVRHVYADNGCLDLLPHISLSQKDQMAELACKMLEEL